MTREQMIDEAVRRHGGAMVSHARSFGADTVMFEFWPDTLARVRKSFRKAVAASKNRKHSGGKRQKPKARGVIPCDAA